jgi:Skp family chaperone for outer membrane proteins
MKRENKGLSGRFYLLLFGVIVAAAIVFLALSVLAHKCFGYSISEETSIIAVIGILATFVVVSNYAQTKAIKDELEEKLQEVDAKYQKLVNSLSDMSDQTSYLAKKSKGKSSEDKKSKSKELRNE